MLVEEEKNMSKAIEKLPAQLRKDIPEFRPGDIAACTRQGCRRFTLIVQFSKGLGALLPRALRQGNVMFVKISNGVGVDAVHQCC